METPLHGVVAIDKPAGLSSAQVVARVKRLTGVRKAGHAGTLDPFATGVLVCCLNRATRLARFLLGGDKTYVTTMILGVETDTQDGTGTVTATRRTSDLAPSQVLAVLARHQGPQQQAPPVYAALKHKGVPLYKLARSGRPVQKPPRAIVVRRLTPLRVALPEVEFEVVCSAGTYVRTLCADMGRALGCGAHVKALRRTRSSGFDIASALSLEQLAARVADGTLHDHVVGLAASLGHLPEIVVDRRVARRIARGCVLSRDEVTPDAVHPEGTVKLVDGRGDLLALVRLRRDEAGAPYEGVFG